MFAEKSKHSLRHLLMGLVFLHPVLNADATGFINMIRMTAGYPSAYSGGPAGADVYYDSEQKNAANKFQLSAGLRTVNHSGQSAYENNPVSQNVTIRKLLYDDGRTDAAIEGGADVCSRQLAQITIAQENINPLLLSLCTTAVTGANIIAVMNKAFARLQDLFQRMEARARNNSDFALKINQDATRMQAFAAPQEMTDIPRHQIPQQLSVPLSQDIAPTRNLPDPRKTGLVPASPNQARKALLENSRWKVSHFLKEEAKAAIELGTKWNHPKWTAQLSLNSPKRNGEREAFNTVTLQLSSDVSVQEGGPRHCAPLPGSSALR
ncbi:hypothetical protein [Candidatus Pantoea deserta]|nr:hypothetical protein [Pantoea deserta]